MRCIALGTRASIARSRFKILPTHRCENPEFKQRFPGDGPKSQISTKGGWLARFSRNELFYVTMGNRLMVAEIHTKPTFGVDSVHPMFQLDFPNPPDRTSPLYDVSADGQRFAVLTADRAKTSSITLLTNWPAELKK